MRPHYSQDRWMRCPCSPSPSPSNNNNTSSSSATDDNSLPGSSASVHRDNNCLADTMVNDYDNSAGVKHHGHFHRHAVVDRDGDRDGD